MKLIEVAVNVPIRRTFGRSAPPSARVRCCGRNPRRVGRREQPADLSLSSAAGVGRRSRTRAPGLGAVWSAETAGRRAAHVRPFSCANQGRPEAGAPGAGAHARADPIGGMDRHPVCCPIGQAIKLFLPPGLLARADGTSAVHAERELRATLLVHGDERAGRLAALARTTQASKLLTWLIAEAAARRGRGCQSSLGKKSSRPWASANAGRWRRWRLRGW